MDDQKKLLLKHSGAVHASSELTFTQKKIFNFFLYNAFPSVALDKYHTIRSSELMGVLGWSSESNLNERLKDALAGLTRENVKWNILDKDRKHKWVSSACLADVSIKSGIISYSFGKFLREVLSNPNLYAKLDLDVQKVLASRDSLVVWEFVMEELSSRRRTSMTTTPVPWEQFCEMTSGENSSYSKNYALYKSKVLKKAILEINEKTNLTLELVEEKQSRRVSKISFKVDQLECIEEEQNAPDAELDTFKKLCIILNNDQKAAEIMKKFAPANIQTALSFYEDAIIKNASSIRNPISFFEKALEEGWCSPEEALSRIKALPKQIEAPMIKLDDSIENKIRALLGNNRFESWFATVTLEERDNTLVLTSPDGFSLDWIESKYKHELEEIARKSGLSTIQILKTAEQ